MKGGLGENLGYFLMQCFYFVLIMRLMSMMGQIFLDSFINNHMHNQFYACRDCVRIQYMVIRHLRHKNTMPVILACIIQDTVYASRPQNRPVVF